MNDGLYEKYDNYDAIEVPKTNLIPSDYYGAMGVPISYLDKHNDNDFELIDKIRPVLHGKILYQRIIIRRRLKLFLKTEDRYISVPPDEEDIYRNIIVAAQKKELEDLKLNRPI